MEAEKKAKTETTPDVVTLKVKGQKDSERPFGLEQANKLLKLKNAQWELSDKAFKWNGVELAKV